MKETEVLK